MKKQKNFFFDYSSSITRDLSRENLSRTTAPEEIELIERGTFADDNPAVLAEIVLRDLFCRAHLNNITACVQPILTYGDNTYDYKFHYKKYFLDI
jgi:hypothetical protein